MQRGEKKVPTDVAIMLVGIAFMFDLMGILSEVETVGIGGLVMDAVSASTFTFWFERYGVQLWSDKNARWSIAAAFFDALPFTDLAFPWTIRVAILAFTERKETPTNVKVKVDKYRL
jgi:hypothetical protein